MIAAVLIGRGRHGSDADSRPRATLSEPASWIAAFAAGLFAIHPFHPSAVLFTGAFATLHSATFSLLATLCFVAARRREAAGGGWRRLDVVGALFFALALGCYEAAVVLPALLLVIAFLLRSFAPQQARERTGWLGAAARRSTPYFVVAIAYLLIRLLVLGTTVGGYAAFRERFLSSPLSRAADLVAALGTLLHPELGTHGRLVWMLWIAAVAAVSVSLRSHAARAVLAALAWIAFSLAPFAFIGLVPANGRYAYLAIAGLVLAVCALAAPIVARWPRGGTVAVVVALVAIGVDWMTALRPTVDAYQRASALVAAVRSDAIGVAVEHAAAGSVLLVEDPPDFIKGARGEPIAKVLQYGLAESVSPPFGPLERAPIPLGAAIRPAARAALGSLPGVARYRWDSSAARLMPVGPQPSTNVSLGIGPFDATGGRLEADCDDCASIRLLVLTPALPFVFAPERVAERDARFEVSHELLDGLARLGDGRAFFWVEEGDGAATTAISPIARFELADAARSFADAADAAAKMRRQ